MTTLNRWESEQLAKAKALEAEKRIRQVSISFLTSGYQVEVERGTTTSHGFSDTTQLIAFISGLCAEDAVG